MMWKCMSCAEVPEYVQAQQNNNINGKRNKNSTDTEKATERKIENQALGHTERTFLLW